MLILLNENASNNRYLKRKQLLNSLNCIELNEPERTIATFENTHTGRFTLGEKVPTHSVTYKIVRGLIFDMAMAMTPK